jgi:hypothetical protein
MSAIADNQIGDAGAQALAKALESDRTLTALYLDGAYPTAAIVALLVLAV